MVNRYREHRNYHRGEDESRIRLYEFIEPDDSVLDVGCGSGWVYENFKYRDLPIKYKGVDLTKNFIEGCKVDFPEAKWEVQDAQELKEKDSSWDVVLLYHVLELVPDWKKAVQEALRVAKKKVVINFWHGYTNYDVKLVREYKDKNNYDYLKENWSNWIGRNEIEEFMVDNGFEPEPTETVEIFPNTYQYFILEKDKWQKPESDT